MARMLVNVVPRRLARIPPTSGVHVLFRLNAESSSPNSVCDVPISRCRRLFSGPRMFVALRGSVKYTRSRGAARRVENALVAADTQAARAEQREGADEECLAPACRETARGIDGSCGCEPDAGPLPQETVWIRGHSVLRAGVGRLSLEQMIALGAQVVLRRAVHAVIERSGHGGGWGERGGIVCSSRQRLSSSLGSAYNTLMPILSDKHGAHRP